MAFVVKIGKRWKVSYRIRGRSRQCIYGIRTAKLAEAARQKKELEEQLARTGLHRPDSRSDSISRAEETPLTELIDQFRASIVAAGRNLNHAQQTASHVRRLCTISNTRYIAEIDPDRLQAACKKLLDDGLAPRTANAACKAARQFSTWLYSTDKTPFDLLHRKLRTFAESSDIRRRRRAMSEEEVNWLLAITGAARDWRSRRCGIKPADRAMLYAIGLGTGFRRRALLSLSKLSFHVGRNMTRPFVRLGAASNKNGLDRDQPIRRDLAESIRKWLESQADAGKVWRPLPHANLSLRFRRDLEAARAAWIAAAATPADRNRREESNTLRYVFDDGRGKVYCDFHSMRHTGITLVVRRAGLRVGQVWADHSTPVLTAKYSHLELVDEALALDALPATGAVQKEKKEKTA